MNSNVKSADKLKWKPSVLIGILVYLGYLTVFYTTWHVNGIEYTNIGKNAETVKLWYALPTLFGCVFLVSAITFLGWWQIVLFDKIKAGPKWLWVFPMVVMLIIINTLLHVNTDKLTPRLLLWVSLGAIGVGFGEEIITRGSLLVGLRNEFNEGKSWLFSTLLFSALHIPNVFFGLPLIAMLGQLVLTFIMGSGFYIARRISGTLILPVVLHGLWDSSLFLSLATGAEPSMWQFVIYPIAIICLIAVFRLQNHESLLKRVA